MLIQSVGHSHWPIYILLSLTGLEFYHNFLDICRLRHGIFGYWSLYFFKRKTYLTSNYIEWKQNMCQLFIAWLNLCYPRRSNYLRQWDSINCHIFMSVPRQDLDFQCYMTWAFLFSTVWRREVVVCVVDISRIVDNHCINLLFILDLNVNKNILFNWHIH